MTTNLLIYVTVPDRDSALAIARGLVANRLTAGANVAGPVQSVYRWRDQVCEAEEWQIFAQASANGFDALAAWITAQHPHQIPCIIAMEINRGSQPFLDWITKNSGGEDSCG